MSSRTPTVRDSVKKFRCKTAYAGIAITDGQLHRAKELIDNPKIKGILVFPLAGKPQETADRLEKAVR